MTLPERFDLARRPLCRAREAIEDDWEFPLFPDDPEIRNEKRRCRQEGILDLRQIADALIEAGMAPRSLFLASETASRCPALPAVLLCE